MTSCLKEKVTLLLPGRVGVLTANLSPADITLKVVWKDASLPLDGHGSPGFLSGFIDRKSEAVFFFFFLQWYMARVEVVIINKISVLLVCPFPGSLAWESRLSLRHFVCVFWHFSSTKSRILGGKKKAMKLITVICSSSIVPHS